ncbi:hypothetical protein V7419_19765 [Bacillus sp. JJ689]|uniref:hypothetical protein n=1 Tax=Bacillus sp. JJ689 TaxID=3122949 RepID=UPI002FFF8051
MYGFGISKEQQMIQELAFVLNKRNYTHEVVNNTKVIVTHEHDGRMIECVAIDGAYTITYAIQNTTTQRKTLQGTVNVIASKLS